MRAQILGENLSLPTTVLVNTFTGTVLEISIFFFPDSVYSSVNFLSSSQLIIYIRVLKMGYWGRQGSSGNIQQKVKIFVLAINPSITNISSPKKTSKNHFRWGTNGIK